MPQAKASAGKSARQIKARNAGIRKVFINATTFPDRIIHLHGELQNNMPENLQKEINDTLQAVRSHFEYLRDLGENTLPRPRAREDLPVCPIGASPESTHGACRPETLEDIRRDLGDCCRCGLEETRRNLVFGVGNPDASLVLVGEAPGSEEDRRGEPFVGEAGQLLDRILQAMRLARADVYICNLLKCRP